MLTWKFPSLFSCVSSTGYICSGNLLSRTKFYVAGRFNHVEVYHSPHIFTNHDLGAYSLNVFLCLRN